MHGIILAGGTGSRLGDLTKAVNKHLLPVADQPMIYWPLEVMHDNGIDDITIVSSPQGIGQLASLLGEGYTYRVQNEPGGIAQAIVCAGRSDGYVAVILGDNVFLPPPQLRSYGGCGRAKCYLSLVARYRVREFGVPTFERGIIKYVTEKPSDPESSYAVTGLYVFPQGVFEEASVVKQSSRGETEVTDLLNRYAGRGLLDHEIVGDFWGDAGTVDGMTECTAAVREWRMTQ